jgi:hypothetical protein
LALAQRSAGSQEQKKHNPYCSNSLHGGAVLPQATSGLLSKLACEHTFDRAFQMPFIWANVLCFLEVGQAISCKLNVSQHSPASMSWTDGEMALA